MDTSKYTFFPCFVAVEVGVVGAVVLVNRLVNILGNCDMNDHHKTIAVQ